MDSHKLNSAISEAKRFLLRAEHLKLLNGSSTYIGDHPKEQGAVKRASMDLTRALAELRSNKE